MKLVLAAMATSYLQPVRYKIVNGGITCFEICYHVAIRRTVQDRPFVFNYFSIPSFTSKIKTPSSMCGLRKMIASEHPFPKDPFSNIEISKISS